MLDFIAKGGPLMWLLVGCSIFAVTIFIERFFHLYRARIDSNRFMNDIRNILEKGQLKEALELCRDTPGPIASLIEVGLFKHDRTREEIRLAMEETATREVSRMERNLNMLSTIAYISPLLGLLGTVSGMIEAFRVIQEKAGAGIVLNPGDLAGGIWQALLTTAAGLMVAIPSYVAYNYLFSRIDYIVLEMQEKASELINLLISGQWKDDH